MIAGDKMPSSMVKVAFSPERTKVNNKELYETPSTMVLEVRQEGVICGSLTVPFLAIRETVLNMLAHRSWWDEDESLSVAIFDDRIVRSHPGINAPPAAAGRDPHRHRRHKNHQNTTASSHTLQKYAELPGLSNLERIADKKMHSDGMTMKRSG